VRIGQLENLAGEEGAPLALIRGRAPGVRLRELTAAGVVDRRRLPPPGAPRVYELTAWGRGLEPIVVALGTWALAAPPTAEQVFVSVDSVMLAIRTYAVPEPGQPDVTLRIELDDHVPSGVFGVHLTDAGAEVFHEPPPEPDAVLRTTTEALLTALGHDDPHRLTEAGSLTGSSEAVRRLRTAVHIPAGSLA
jgi:hypothetical protein